MDGLLSQSRVLNSSIFGAGDSFKTKAGDTEIHVPNNEATGTLASTNSGGAAGTYYKRRGILMNYAGTIRLTFTIASTTSNTVYCQIRRDGDVLGTYSTDNVALACSIDISFTAGQEIQFYIKTNAGGQASQINVYGQYVKIDEAFIMEYKYYSGGTL